MNCETLREQAIDFWRDELGASERETFERHLEECAECAAEHERLSLLWNELGALDDPQAVPVPSAQLRSRFYRSLERYQEELERPPVWRRWWDALSSGTTLQPAWSLPTLVMGVALGAAIMWAVGARNEIDRLSTELADSRRAVSLSLLSHESASERIRGVSWGSRAPGDDRIVEALLASVRSDPNVNVRLAALEALAQQIDTPRVQAGLVETLPRQESPVLQVALAEILSERNQGGQVAIEELLERPDLDEQVRTQIQLLLESV